MSERGGKGRREKQGIIMLYRIFADYIRVTYQRVTAHVDGGGHADDVGGDKVEDGAEEEVLGAEEARAGDEAGGEAVDLDLAVLRLEAARQLLRAAEGG